MTPRSVFELLTQQGSTEITCHDRRVHDGELHAVVAFEPLGWHLSISHEARSTRALQRYPTWDEIAHARYELLPLDLDFVMHLPPPDDFIAVHDTTFHLHELRES